MGCASSAVATRHDVPQLPPPTTTVIPSAFEPLAELCSVSRFKGGDGEFRAGQILGRGAFGFVFSGLHNSSGVHYALKRIVLSTSKNPGALLRELRVLRHLASVMRGGTGGSNDGGGDRVPPRDECGASASSLPPASSSAIVDYVDAYVVPTHVVFVFERCLGGNLLDFLLRQPGERLTEAGAKVAMSILCGALAFLHHTAGIIHRDIKLENILLRKAGSLDSLCIVDFGLSELSPLPSTPFKKVVGTWSYSAPEMLALGAGVVDEETSYDTTFDVYSLGVVFYVLLAGSHPYDGFPGSAGRKLALAGAYSTVPLQHVQDNQAKSLLYAMLEFDPKKRIQSIDLLRHPYFRDWGVPRESSVSESARSFCA